MNDITIASLCNAAGNNIWCSRISYVHWSLLYELHLGRRIIKIEIPPHRNYLNEQKHIPEQIKRTKFGKKSIVVYRKRNTLVLAWKDKRVVTCLTNWDNTGMTPVKRILRDGVEVTVKKPNVVINYIKHMGGVDRIDQYASTYCFLRK